MNSIHPWSLLLVLIPDSCLDFLSDGLRAVTRNKSCPPKVAFGGVFITTIGSEVGQTLAPENEM